MEILDNKGEKNLLREVPDSGTHPSLGLFDIEISYYITMVFEPKD